MRWTIRAFYHSCLLVATRAYIWFVLELIEFADSNAESVPTMSICKELLLKEPCELHILPSASQKGNPPETLPKQEQKRVPSRSVSKTITPPKRDTQSTAYDFDVKSIHHDSRNTENVAIYRMVWIIFFDITIFIVDQHHSLLC